MGWRVIIASLILSLGVPLVHAAETISFAIPTANELSGQSIVPPIMPSGAEWKGALSGMTQQDQLIFRDEGAWEDFWRAAIEPYLPVPTSAPAVDFSKTMVVGVFLGELNSTLEDVEILSRVSSDDSLDPVLVIYYRVVSRMPGLFTDRFTTRPFHMKCVPFFTGGVEFKRI